MEPAAGRQRRGATGRAGFVAVERALLGDEQDRGLCAASEALERRPDAGDVARERALHLVRRFFDGGEVVRRMRDLGAGFHGGRGSPGSVDLRWDVGIAQGHDELRYVRGRVDGDFDAVDARWPLAAVLGVFELELLADLEESKVATDRDLVGMRVLDLGTHGRREAFDVQTHFRACVNLRRAASDSAEALERIDALGVHLGESDAKLAALGFTLRPYDFAGDEDGLARSPVEATRQRLPELGQISRAQVNSVLGNVHGLRLERWPKCRAHLDQSVERHPRGSRCSAILGAHLFLRSPSAIEN
jgi:hypothetical protein